MQKLAPTRSLTVKNFSKVARPLRETFVEKFKDARNTVSSRFVWDYWQIEDQYRVLRTPARYFFSAKDFSRLQNELLAFGQSRLGCNGISDPWLSLYVDGCYQNLHSDSPHGPWAYVFSLTPWKNRRFSGGETLLARDRLLDFWSHYLREQRDQVGIERVDLVEEIPAEFNQLTLFDPRIPHGVKPVRGVESALEGRLVVHGWFVEPRPFLQGGLAKKNPKFLDGILKPIHSELSRFSEIQGTLSVRVHVSPNGRVGRQDLLVHTLVNTREPGDLGKITEVIRTVAELFNQARFPTASTRSELTIPFLFRS